MQIKGCGCLFLLKIFTKKGLDAMRTNLWTSACWPSSQARVTSVNSLSSFISLWSIFFLQQYFLQKCHMYLSCRSFFLQFVKQCIGMSNNTSKMEVAPWCFKRLYSTAVQWSTVYCSVHTLYKAKFVDIQTPPPLFTAIFSNCLSPRPTL